MFPLCKTCVVETLTLKEQAIAVKCFPHPHVANEETFMSKGPGRVQRIISQMIAEEPEGAWTTDEICRRVYPDGASVDKKHRVAVLRALRRMKFPSNDWRFKSVGKSDIASENS